MVGMDWIELAKSSVLQSHKNLRPEYYAAGKSEAERERRDYGNILSL
jgi:hypothetical protein